MPPCDSYLLDVFKGAGICDMTSGVRTRMKPSELKSYLDLNSLTLNPYEVDAILEASQEYVNYSNQTDPSVSAMPPYIAKVNPEENSEEVKKLSW